MKNVQIFPKDIETISFSREQADAHDSKLQWVVTVKARKEAK